MNFDAPVYTFADEITGLDSWTFDTAAAASAYVSSLITDKPDDDVWVQLGVQTSADGVLWQTVNDLPPSPLHDPLPEGGVAGGVVVACPGPYTRVLWDIVDDMAQPSSATVELAVSFGLVGARFTQAPVD